ncbi:hypothetical protein TNCV_3194911 [Trichonephila clavipes]|uniref:Uncharacterized protein n=1 Tax=Trichonephila clavipes TaxID=2585209 RepID=A0A8X6UWQ5_TRICX|nr:hypothetical protein TNCV_3194911 [Trichonephila clavipes]
MDGSLIDPLPDVAVLYPWCTIGKPRTSLLPIDRHLLSFVGLRGGWRLARMSSIFLFVDPNMPCLVIPTIPIESKLPIPISNITTTSPGNSLNTSDSSAARLYPSTTENFAAVSTDIQPSFPYQRL